MVALQCIVWLRQRNLRSMVLFLIVAVGCWGFAELADEVGEGETQAIDEMILRSLRDPQDMYTPIGPGWLREGMRDITALGSATVLTLVIAFASGFCLIVRDRYAMWLVLGAGLGGMVLSWLLKSVLLRERPTAVPHMVDVYTPSFPSGHSMLSAIVYLTLGIMLARVVRRRTLKLYFILVAIFLTVLVGVSRIYLGVHYPTDVLAGWTAGAVWAVICGTWAAYVDDSNGPGSGK
jgi:undecaprenyl-diphosphatase